MLAEGMAAGIAPHILLDYTPRELYSAFRGRNILSVRQHQLALFTAWYVEHFARHKKLPVLADMLRRLEPSKPMSKRAIRSAIVEAAKNMGAKIRYVKKGELN